MSWLPEHRFNARRNDADVGWLFLRRCAEFAVFCCSYLGTGGGAVGRILMPVLAFRTRRCHRPIPCPAIVREERHVVITPAVFPPTRGRTRRPASSWQYTAAPVRCVRRQRHDVYSYTGVPHAGIRFNVRSFVYKPTMAYASTRDNRRGALTDAASR